MYRHHHGYDKVSTGYIPYGVDGWVFTSDTTTGQFTRNKRCCCQKQQCREGCLHVRQPSNRERLQTNQNTSVEVGQLAE